MEILSDQELLDYYRAMTGYRTEAFHDRKDGEFRFLQAMKEFGYALTDEGKLVPDGRRDMPASSRRSALFIRRIIGDPTAWPTPLEAYMDPITIDTRAHYTQPRRSYLPTDPAPEPAPDAQRDHAPRQRVAPTTVLVPIPGSRKVPAGTCSELLPLFDGVRTYAEVEKLALEKGVTIPPAQADDPAGHIRGRTGKLIRIGAIAFGG